MVTAISQAAFEVACGETYDAIAAESWKSAWLWYARAEAQHSALAAGSTAGPMSLQRRDALTGLREALRSAEAASARYSQTSRLGRLGTRHKR